MKHLKDKFTEVIDKQIESLIEDVIIETQKATREETLREVLHIMQKSDLAKFTQFIEMARGVGHTTAAVNGVLNTEGAKLLVASVEQARALGLEPRQYVTIGQVSTNRLRGLRSPVIVDNHAVSTMFMRIVGEISRQSDFLMGR